jgi:hypothetical protein
MVVLPVDVLQDAKPLQEINETDFIEYILDLDYLSRDCGECL